MEYIIIRVKAVIPCAECARRAEVRQKIGSLQAKVNDGAVLATIGKLKEQIDESAARCPVCKGEGRLEKEMELGKVIDQARGQIDHIIRHVVNDELGNVNTDIRRRVSDLAWKEIRTAETEKHLKSIMRDVVAEFWNDLDRIEVE